MMAGLKKICHKKLNKKFPNLVDDMMMDGSEKTVVSI